MSSSASPCLRALARMTGSISHQYNLTGSLLGIDREPPRTPAHFVTWPPRRGELDRQSVLCDVTPLQT